MAMTVSYSNRDIINLFLTTPRDYHTKLVWGGSGYRQLTFGQVMHNPSRQINL